MSSNAAWLPRDPTPLPIYWYVVLRIGTKIRHPTQPGCREPCRWQKGFFFKLLIPFFVMLPGIIAFHLYGPDIGGMDKAYPRLVRDVLPSYLIGLFLAVVRTVFSSFNSLLQKFGDHHNLRHCHAMAWKNPE